VTLLPSEGVLQPYAEQVITFIFKPVDKEKPPSFRAPFLGGAKAASDSKDEGECELRMLSRAPMASLFLSCLRLVTSAFL
jgi:hypothetical protein